MMLMDLRLPDLSMILHNEAFKFCESVFGHVNSVAQYVHYCSAYLSVSYVCLSVCLSLCLFLLFIWASCLMQIHTYIGPMRASFISAYACLNCLVYTNVNGDIVIYTSKTVEIKKRWYCPATRCQMSMCCRYISINCRFLIFIFAVLLRYCVSSRTIGQHITKAPVFLAIHCTIG